MSDACGRRLFYSTTCPTYIISHFFKMGNCVSVWIGLKVAESGIAFSSFFFFSSLRMNSKITRFYCAGDKKHCSCTVHRSHDTIHTFKNYFTTVFSVFSFNNNKFNPNGPCMELGCHAIKKIRQPHLFCT